MHEGVEVGGVGVVCCVGGRMRWLWDTLDGERRGAWVKTS